MKSVLQKIAALCFTCILTVSVTVADDLGYRPTKPDQQHLHHKIKSCGLITFCGSYVKDSCHPEADGPVRYYNNVDGSLIMNCGGACMGGPGPSGSKRCTACPPPEWICEAGSYGT
jgi:hypothetical protein